MKFIHNLRTLNKLYYLSNILNDCLNNLIRLSNKIYFCVYDIITLATT